MRPLIETCLLASILIAGAAAQKPLLRQGVQVEMPVASHAIETRAADGQNATVLAITADGRVFDGIKLIDSAALLRLKEKTIYVKADARAQYQKVLAVLDALRGKSVVLLSAPPENAAKEGYTAPYGTKLTVSR